MLTVNEIKSQIETLRLELKAALQVEDFKRVSEINTALCLLKDSLISEYEILLNKDIEAA